jgi:hypothetical protein
MAAPVLQSSDQLRPDEKPLAEYVPVSRAALAALALGVASPLIFVSPLLVVVPVAAVCVAALALRQIAGSGGQLKGQWLATIGLCLASLFLGWGLTRQMGRQVTLADYAQQFVESWLTLVKDGKLQQADQMRRSISERIGDDASLAEYYRSNKDAADSMQSLFADEPLKSFRDAGPQVAWRLDSVVDQSPSRDGENVMLKYDFSTADGSTRSMWISAVRSVEGAAQKPSWVIRSVEASLPSHLQ